MYTSAGVTAGLDLALALVEDDLGREVVLSVARWLVMYLRRSGGQEQFSTHLARRLARWLRFGTRVRHSPFAE